MNPSPSLPQVGQLLGTPAPERGVVSGFHTPDLI